MYIAEKIGEEYKNWVAGNKIFITAPTGSGKTTFVFNVLLPFVCMQNKKILYLVNRKALKDQLKNKLRDLQLSSFELRNAQYNIEIRTYQELEEWYKKNHTIHQCLLYTSYIVCDEAHYFIEDSLFNTETFLSYAQINSLSDKVVTIFISATIGKMKEYFLNIELEKIRTSQSGLGPLINSAVANTENNFNNSCKEYTIDKNYDYLNIHTFSKISEITEIIKQDKTNSKWIMFYNNSADGKRIEKELVHAKKSAIFIDSSYRFSEDTYNTVQTLSKDKIMSYDVIICTSVFDNGISIEDEALRNIVILADTETEFIQMLGRKRKDKNTVNLYLCMREKKYFSDRLQNVTRIWDALTKCKKMINMQSILMDNMLKCPDFFKQASHFLFQSNIGPMDKFAESRLEISQNNINIDNIIKTYSLNSGVYLTFYRNEHINFDNKQNYLGININVNNEQNTENSENKIITVVFHEQENSARLYINPFSELHLMEYISFLKSVIEEIQENPDAFLKRQLSWLDYPESKINRIVYKKKEERVNEIYAEIITLLDEFVEVPQNAVQIEEFRKNALLPLLKKYVEEFSSQNNGIELKKQISSSLRKNILTPESFASVMQKINLEYTLSTNGANTNKDKIYTIQKK